MPKPVDHSGGVYRIACSTTQQEYVGSSRDMNLRKLTHFSELRRGVHPNKGLQSAWNLYGADTFEFSVIEIVQDTASRYQREQYWIGQLTGLNSTTLRSHFQ